MLEATGKRHQATERAIDEELMAVQCAAAYAAQNAALLQIHLCQERPGS